MAFISPRCCNVHGSKHWMKPGRAGSCQIIFVVGGITWRKKYEQQQQQQRGRVYTTTCRFPPVKKNKTNVHVLICYGTFSKNISGHANKYQVYDTWFRNQMVRSHLKQNTRTRSLKQFLTHFFPETIPIPRGLPRTCHLLHYARGVDCMATMVRCAGDIFHVATIRPWPS